MSEDIIKMKYMSRYGKTKLMLKSGTYSILVTSNHSDGEEQVIQWAQQNGRLQNERLFGKIC